jgi:hypothetical protein
MQKAINAINELVEEAGKPEWDWQAAAEGRSAGCQSVRSGQRQAGRSLQHHRQADA